MIAFYKEAEMQIQARITNISRQRQILFSRSPLPVKTGLDPRAVLGERPLKLLQQWQVITPPSLDRVEAFRLHSQLETTQGMLAFNEAAFPIAQEQSRDTFSMVMAVCGLLCGREFVEELLRQEDRLPSECFFG